MGQEVRSYWWFEGSLLFCGSAYGVESFGASVEGWLSLVILVLMVTFCWFRRKVKPAVFVSLCVVVCPCFCNLTCKYNTR